MTDDNAEYWIGIPDEREAEEAKRRCGNCKHWGTEPYDYLYDDEGDDLPVPHAQCGAVTHVNGFLKRAVADGDVKAFTTDASGYRSALWTAPDFGCVLFERKESE